MKSNLWWCSILTQFIATYIVAPAAKYGRVGNMLIRPFFSSHQFSVQRNDKNCIILKCIRKCSLTHRRREGGGYAAGGSRVSAQNRMRDPHGLVGRVGHHVFDSGRRNGRWRPNLRYGDAVHAGIFSLPLLARAISRTNVNTNERQPRTVSSPKIFFTISL